MINKTEAASIAKSIYMLSASLSGLKIRDNSADVLTYLIDEAYPLMKGQNARRPEAVANMLRIIAGALDEAQKSGRKRLGEDSIAKGKEKVCPVYPFD